MCAKIKTQRKHSYDPSRPRGISQKHFTRVYWPYLPLLLIIGALSWYGSSHGSFSNLQTFFNNPLPNRSYPADTQLAFAPLSSKLAIASIWSVLIAALTIFIGRYIHKLRRSLKHGEKFVITHPLLDVCLIVIAALAYLVTQTANYTF